MKLQSSTGDPLLYEFGLALRATYYFMGFPVEIITNSAEVLAAAQESWGMFHKIFSAPLIQIRIGVLPGSTDECPPSPICRGQRNLITQLANSENFMMSDTRQGFAFGWLTEAVVNNRAYLRYHFLEGTAWILLEALYLTFVHGACVELDGHGVLLCGDSGAGKSSLAYSCAQNGWKYLCDDATGLVRKGAGRVATGNPYQMRFRESAVELFPELIHQRVTPGATGEMAIELPTTTRQEISIISECSVDYIVFLNRFAALPCGLTRFPKETAMQWFEQVVCYGEGHVREAHCATLRKLLAAEFFEMRYKQMDSALRWLENLVRNGPVDANEALIVAGGPENG
jgi:HPr Serine kinase C-terminal domain